jgi:hypothetical protein
MASMLSAAFRMGTSAVLAIALASACANESRSDQSAAPSANRENALSATCQDCVLNREPGCRFAYDACIANVKCSRVALCEFEHGCMATAAIEKDCLRLCLSAASIRTLTDPAFQLVLKLNVCTYAHCRSACGAG